MKKETTDWRSKKICITQILHAFPPNRLHSKCPLNDSIVILIMFICLCSAPSQFCGCMLFCCCCMYYWSTGIISADNDCSIPCYVFNMPSLGCYCWSNSMSLAPTQAHTEHIQYPRYPFLCKYTYICMQFYSVCVSSAALFLCISSMYMILTNIHNSSYTINTILLLLSHSFPAYLYLHVCNIFFFWFSYDFPLGFFFLQLGAAIRYFVMFMFYDFQSTIRSMRRFTCRSQRWKWRKNSANSQATHRNCVT